MVHNGYNYARKKGFGKVRLGKQQCECGTVHNEDKSFLQLSANKKLSYDKVLIFLSVPQERTYKVENGIITTFDNTGNIVERYSCSFFLRDFPRGNIKSGTLSLLWFKNNKPFILNTYTKIKNNLTSQPSGR